MKNSHEEVEKLNENQASFSSHQDENIENEQPVNLEEEKLKEISKALEQYDQYVVIVKTEDDPAVLVKGHPFDCTAMMARVFSEFKMNIIREIDV